MHALARFDMFGCVKGDAIQLGGAILLFADPRFDPERPPREQLSALGERLFEAGLPDGRVLRVGWVPERSPGGAFRLELAGVEHGWVESWPLVQQALAALTAGSR